MGVASDLNISSFSFQPTTLQMKILYVFLLLAVAEAQYGRRLQSSSSSTSTTKKTTTAVKTTTAAATTAVKTTTVAPTTTKGADVVTTTKKADDVTTTKKADVVTTTKKTDGTTTKAGTTKAGATTKAREVVGGSLTLDLGADGEKIMKDEKKKAALVTAMKKTMAEITGAKEADVTITLALARRLQEGRRLASHATKKIKCDYSVTLPAGTTASSAASTIKAKPVADIATIVKKHAKADSNLGTLTVSVSGAQVTTTKAPTETGDARAAGLGMLLLALVVS